MKLHIKRSQSVKSKLLGGSETTFFLAVKAALEESEMGLLKKHGRDKYQLNLPADLLQSVEQGKIQGPRGVSIPDVTAGVHWSAKALYTAMTTLPNEIQSELVTVLAQIRAREEWGGEQTLDVNY